MISSPSWEITNSEREDEAGPVAPKPSLTGSSDWRTWPLGPVPGPLALRAQPRPGHGQTPLFSDASERTKQGGLPWLQTTFSKLSRLSSAFSLLPGLETDLENGGGVSATCGQAASAGGKLDSEASGGTAGGTDAARLVTRWASRARRGAASALAAEYVPTQGGSPELLGWNRVAGKGRCGFAVRHLCGVGRVPREAFSEALPSAGTECCEPCSHAAVGIFCQGWFF